MKDFKETLLQYNKTYKISKFYYQTEIFYIVKKKYVFQKNKDNILTNQLLYYIIIIGNKTWKFFKKK